MKLLSASILVYQRSYDDNATDYISQRQIVFEVSSLGIRGPSAAASTPSRSYAPVIDPKAVALRYLVPWAQVPASDGSLR